MPFDWQQYEVLAQELRQRSDNEACLRSAISRLYYSVYWRARQHLERSEGFTINQNGSEHFQVWNYFKRRGGRTNSTIGTKGDMLKLNRIDADYKSEFPTLEKRVVESFGLADAILHFLGQIQRAESGGRPNDN
jgi:hypothetical protein